MDKTYEVPPLTRIGHVHLKVADLQRSLDFYCEVLAFKCVARQGENVAYVSAGDYHHHIGLNTWYSRNAQPPPNKSTGLFHVALLYPTRKDLGKIYKRLHDYKCILTGMVDHGTSEAIYLSDPDGNGLQLYCDRDPSLWPRDEEGNIKISSQPLDISSLLSELEDQ